MGEPGSEAHSRRERLLRACIGLRDQLAAATQRVGTVRFALDAAADAHPNSHPVTSSNPARGAAGAAGPPRAAADAQMALIFGSSDEEDASGHAGPASAGRRIVGAAHAQDRSRGAGLSPAGRRAGSSAACGHGTTRARAAASAGPPAPIVDPTERPRAPAALALSPAALGRTASPGQAAAAATPPAPAARGALAKGADPARALPAGVAAAARKAQLPATLKEKLLQKVCTLTIFGASIASGQNLFF